MSAVDNRRTSYPKLHAIIFLTALSNYIFHLLGYYIEPFALISGMILGVELSEAIAFDERGLLQVKSTLSALLFLFVQATNSAVIIAFLLYRRIKSLFLPLRNSEIESAQMLIYIVFMYVVAAFMLTPYGLSMFSSNTSKISTDPYWLKLLILTFFWPLILSGSVLSLLEPSKISDLVGKYSTVSRSTNKHRKGR